MSVNDNRQWADGFGTIDEWFVSMSIEVLIDGGLSVALYGLFVPMSMDASVASSPTSLLTRAERPSASTHRRIATAAASIFSAWDEGGC